MKERPILFSSPMVRAKLDNGNAGGASPYGTPGDRLWVRETWGLYDTEPSEGPARATKFYRATDGERHELRFVHEAEQPLHALASEAGITLEVVSVRVEQLHDISEVAPLNPYAALGVALKAKLKRQREALQDKQRAINEMNIAAVHSARAEALK